MRKLHDLAGIGPAMLKDFELLGIHSVEELSRQEPAGLYQRLCRVTNQKQDICVLDTFRAVVAQARDPDLPVEKRNWWYWSRARKAGDR